MGVARQYVEVKGAADYARQQIWVPSHVVNQLVQVLGGAAGIYAAARSDGIYTYDIASDTWTNHPLPDFPFFAHSDLGQTDTAYVSNADPVTGNNLVYSSPDGIVWTAGSQPGVGFDLNNFAVAGDGRVWAIWHEPGVSLDHTYYSDDKGVTWTLSRAGIAGQNWASIAVKPGDSNSAAQTGNNSGTGVPLASITTGGGWVDSNLEAYTENGDAVVWSSAGNAIILAARDPGIGTGLNEWHFYYSNGGAWTLGAVINNGYDDVSFLNYGICSINGYFFVAGQEFSAVPFLNHLWRTRDGITVDELPLPFAGAAFFGLTVTGGALYGSVVDSPTGVKSFWRLDDCEGVATVWTALTPPTLSSTVDIDLLPGA